MPFTKGKSGNPKGRPRKIENAEDMRTLARSYTDQSIGAIAKALASRNERHRLMAANSMLDRGWGRVPQAITGVDGGAVRVETTLQPSAFASLTDEQRKALHDIADTLIASSPLGHVDEPASAEGDASGGRREEVGEQ